MAFHYSERLGRMAPCGAQSPETCPMPGPDGVPGHAHHEADEASAHAYMEKKLADQYGTLSTVSTKSASEGEGEGTSARPFTMADFAEGVGQARAAERGLSEEASGKLSRRNFEVAEAAALREASLPGPESMPTYKGPYDRELTPQEARRYEGEGLLQRRGAVLNELRAAQRLHTQLKARAMTPEAQVDDYIRMGQLTRTMEGLRMRVKNYDDQFVALNPAKKDKARDYLNDKESFRREFLDDSASQLDADRDRVEEELKALQTDASLLARFRHRDRIKLLRKELLRDKELLMENQDAGIHAKNEREAFLQEWAQD